MAGHIQQYTVYRPPPQYRYCTVHSICLTFKKTTRPFLLVTVQYDVILPFYHTMNSV